MVTSRTSSRAGWRACLRAGGDVCGAGVLVDSGHVLTSATAAEIALTWGDSVPVRFLTGGHAAQPAEVDWWGPDATPSSDVAVLRLPNGAPQGTEPAPLAAADPPVAQELRVFGFPHGAAIGSWVAIRVTDIPRPASDWLPVDGAWPVGVRVAGGFSGAGAVDIRGAVVGLVLGDSSMIPISAIARNWPPILDLIIPAPPPLPPTLSGDDFFLLVEALEAIPSMRDEHTRRLVITELPGPISGAIRYHAHRRAHVMSIARTCLDYEDGIVQLLAILRGLEDEGSLPLRRLLTIVARLAPGLAL